jgi:hypothetical protein
LRLWGKLHEVNFHGNMKKWMVFILVEIKLHENETLKQFLRVLLSAKGMPHYDMIFRKTKCHFFLRIDMGCLPKSIVVVIA